MKKTLWLLHWLHELAVAHIRDRVLILTKTVQTVETVRTVETVWTVETVRTLETVRTVETVQPLETVQAVAWLKLEHWLDRDMHSSRQTSWVCQICVIWASAGEKSCQGRLTSMTQNYNKRTVCHCVSGNPHLWSQLFVYRSLYGTMTKQGMRHHKDPWWDQLFLSYWRFLL